MYHLSSERLSFILTSSYSVIHSCYIQLYSPILLFFLAEVFIISGFSLLILGRDCIMERNVSSLLFWHSLILIRILLFLFLYWHSINLSIGWLFIWLLTFSVHVQSRLKFSLYNGTLLMSATFFLFLFPPLPRIINGTLCCFTFLSFLLHYELEQLCSYVLFYFIYFYSFLTFYSSVLFSLFNIIN